MQDKRNSRSVAVNHGESQESGESSEFSIATILAFQNRLKSDPDSVSDKEIQAESGTDISPSDIRDLFRRSTFNRASKNPRASARAKLRRRLVWLNRSLEQVKCAVKEVFDAPGRTNKRNELETILEAIEEFRSAVKLPAPQQPSDIDPDLFERLLGNTTYEQPPEDFDSIELKA